MPPVGSCAPRRGARSCRRRRPRTRQRHEIRIALIPNYVFARSAYIDDLSQLSARRRFTLLHDEQGPILIHDAELDPLRHAEARATPKHKPRPALPFTIAETVRIPSGSFQGLSGTVQASDERNTMLSFGRFELKIETCHLREAMAEAA